MHTLTINDKDYSIDVPNEMPLLWAIRDIVGLTGTKFGCGVAQCGACSIMINGVVVRVALLLSVKPKEDKSPPLRVNLQVSKFLRKAWQEINVPQCGYCQSGQLISAAALLDTNKAPTDEDIDNAMSGNICRCGTYVRIRKAIHKAVDLRNNNTK